MSEHAATITIRVVVTDRAKRCAEAHDCAARALGFLPLLEGETPREAIMRACEALNPEAPLKQRPTPREIGPCPGEGATPAVRRADQMRTLAEPDT